MPQHVRLKLRKWKSMTDRYHSLTVVLENNLRTDDVEPLMNAIRQLRGVLKVSGEVSDVNSHMAELRARADLGQRVLNVITGGIRIA